VTRFLDLEVRSDFKGSFGSLSASDRAATPTRAEWLGSHASLAPVIGYRIDGISEHADRAEVVTRVDLRSSLDLVDGLVPAHALATWVVVPEDGGWRVAYARSSLSPIYPPDAAAPSVVRGWARDRQVCRRPTEWDGGLLGVGALGTAGALCHAKGAVQVGHVTDLTDSAGEESLLSAFGPDVGRWARVVPVTAPVAMNVVVAPVGESWLVIGVLEASPGSAP
jgi:hypothetical protein